MTTIEDYIKYTDEMRETGVLSPDFHIIQYSDGCCLGIDGKSMAFEDRAANNRDYVFWNHDGYAFRTADDEDTLPMFDETGGVQITKAPRLVCAPSLNLPTVPKSGLEGMNDKVNDVARMLRLSNVAFCMIFSNNNNSTIDGRLYGSNKDWACALLASMLEHKGFAEAVRLAYKAYIEHCLPEKPTDPNVS